MPCKSRGRLSAPVIAARDLQALKIETLVRRYLMMRAIRSMSPGFKGWMHATDTSDEVICQHSKASSAGPVQPGFPCALRARDAWTESHCGNLDRRRPP